MKLILNFISKLGVDSISRLIGFLTLPLITRALGPDGYGLYSYLFVILSYFGFFIDFGYLNYGTNKLCDKVDSKIVISKIISLQLVTLIFTFLVLVVAGYFIFDSGKYVLLLIFSATFISQIFAIKYYYLANNKLYYNSISELSGQLVYAGLIFTIFLKLPSVMTLIILSIVQSGVTAIFLIIPYIKKNNLHIDFNLSSNLKTLREAYKLGISTKAEGITSSFIILCIGLFLNEESVGLYNASFKIYLILLTVVQGVSYTLMPVLLKNAKSTNRNNEQRISLIFYVFLFLGIILSLATYFFSERIIAIMFGEKFSESVFILKIFSITILIQPIVMFMSLIVLAYNKYNYILLISITSMVLSVFFSLVLINLMGIDGAGYVLPLVSIGTIFVCIHSLKKISVDENFSVIDLFSPDNAYREFIKIVKIKN